MEKAFEEKQRFADKTVMLLVLIPLLIFTVIGFTTENLLVPAIIGLCLVFTAALMYSLELQVIIDKKGVHYKFFPFHTTFRLQSWDDIRRCRVIPVNAISDFGGIGLRYKSKTVGYIINSKFGIEMERKNGRFIVVSATRQEEAAAAMQYYWEQMHQ
ncbi:MAG: hypothetical protein R2824_35025 [Saprospiraceae bacterium]|nr:hypothetical protein [Lewinella sp.]